MTRQSVETGAAILALLVLVFWAGQDSRAVESWQREETRICGTPKRNAAGEIIRSAAVRDSFRKVWACPATGLKDGRCDGWQIDHVIPLAQGGCDAVSNMQWLPVAIKTCSLSTGVPCKDRWEQEVYATSWGTFPQ